MGVKQVTVGVVAVFDGHNGAEASDMASKLLLEYFALHTYFLLDATFSVVLKKLSGRLPNAGERDIVFQVLNWDEEPGGHELNFERCFNMYIQDMVLFQFLVLEKQIKLLISIADMLAQI